MRWVRLAIKVVATLLGVMGVILGSLEIAVLTEFGIVSDAAWFGVPAIALVAALGVYAFWSD